jgi:hypothetical protein
VNSTSGCTSGTPTRQQPNRKAPYRAQRARVAGQAFRVVRTTIRIVNSAGAPKPFAATIVAILTLSAGVISPTRLDADQVAVRYAEGVSHGYLRLRADDHTVLADGEMTQRGAGDRVTSRLTFRFRDGSVYDETTVFLQQRHFRLVTEHVVQRGPLFHKR